MILFELAISVDPSKGKDVAERLLALYDYMQSRLVEANAEQKDGPLAEVDNLLGTLQEAWSQCEEAELALRERFYFWTKKFPTNRASTPDE